MVRRVKTPKNKFGNIRKIAYLYNVNKTNNSSYGKILKKRKSEGFNQFD